MGRIKLLITLFFLHTIVALASTNCHWHTISPDFDKLTLSAERWSQGARSEVDIASIVSQMDSISRINPGNKVMRARTLYWTVCADPAMGLDKACRLLDTAIGLAKDGDKYDLARLDMQKAVVLSKQGDYPEAYQLYVSAGKTFAKAGDSRLLAYTYYNIAYIFLLLGEYGDAETNAMDADSLFKALHLDDHHINTELLLVNIYEKAGKSQDALRLLNGMARYDQEQMPPPLRVMFFTAYLPYISDPDSLIKYSDAAHRLAMETGDKQLYITSLLNRGWSFVNTGQADSAAACVAEARQAASGLNSTRVDESVYKLLAKVNEMQHRWDSAYHFQRLYYDSHEAARGDGVLADVRAVGMKQEIEEYRVASLLEKEKEEAWIRTSLIIGLSLLVLLTASIYIIYVLRRKMQEEQRRQMQKDHEHIARLSQEKELVESKNRELSANSILLMKKNDSLKKALKEMENIHKNFHVDIGDIKSEIVSSLKGDESWDTFKLHFERVHPQFFSILKKMYPRLTDNELRLCAYIRIGLSNKQIAQMLLVQSKAVIQARYRLKKRMELPETTSVSDFLVNLTLSSGATQEGGKP